MKLEMPNLRRPRGGEGMRVPAPVTDVIHDLRERRLLPLVGLLVVMIVAAPFLLANPDPNLAPTTGQTGIAVTPGTGQPELAVVAESPVGLRDYKTRLRRLTAKNPFRQHFTAPRVAGANLGPAGASPATTTSPTSTTPTADLSSTSPPAPSPVPSVPSGSPTGGNGNLGGGGGGDGGSGGSGGGKGPVRTELIRYEIDASVGAPGETKVRRGLSELTMLPNRKNPVAIFMGVTPDAKRALFLLSTDVTSVFGDTRCGFGDSTCQLVELEPGFPVSITYGPKDKHYRIAVLGIHEAGAGKPAPKASKRSPRVGLRTAQKP